uniref:Uncharacterized protein n=1 Tax=Plectus sambesii TaxID=2011161 RepID=A0A914VUI4_9BILA
MWAVAFQAILWIVQVYVSYRLVRTIFALLWGIFVYFIAPVFYKPNLAKYKGRWTVITGGTDGIGKAYTLELAKRGLEKFILIGRNETKLRDIAVLLETRYKARVKTFVFDFECDDYAKLREYLRPVDVGFVLNSVGVGPSTLERFGDKPEVDRMVLKVNAIGVSEFMIAVLPPMREHGGGQIVNLGSSQGYRVVPLMGPYCTSKSVVAFLSEAIDREQDNIRVQCLTPALVATNMTHYKEGSMFVVTPDHFANAAVNTIGLVTVTTGCFNHEFQMLLRHLFPWTLLKHLITPIYSRHKRRLIALHEKESRTTHRA